MGKLTDAMLEEKQRTRDKHHKTIIDAIDRMGINDYGEQPDMSKITLIDLSKISPSPLAAFKKTRNPPPTLQEILQYARNLERGFENTVNLLKNSDFLLHEPILSLAGLQKDIGNEYYRLGRYQEAMSRYMAAYNIILKTCAPNMPTTVPSTTTFLSETYIHIAKDCMTTSSWKAIVELCFIAANMAQCHSKLDEHVKEIDWLHEVQQLLMALRIQGLTTPEPVWRDFQITAVDYWVPKIKNNVRCSNKYMKLGNTALAASFGKIACVDYYTAPNADKYPRLKALLSEAISSQFDAIKYRHPDPTLITRTEVTCPELQMRGFWEKLAYKSGSKRPSGRSSFSSWFWRGGIYICSGNNNNHEQMKDFWVLKVSDMSWRQLPDLPATAFRLIGYLAGHRPMQVWENKAYLFHGFLEIHVFDLVTEKWSTINTTMSQGKPWPVGKKGHNFRDFSTTLTPWDGKLYVFGGDDGATSLGCNLFLVLNLATREWDHISGTSESIPLTREPSLRVLASLWNVPEERKVYLMYGNVTRQAASYEHRPGGASMDHTCDDFWSFDPEKQVWEREKLRGSYPCVRTEMATAYCPSIGATVVYGGYNASIPTHDQIGLPSKLPKDQPQMYSFSFFGDTFVYDSKTKIWKHVLIRGFPSYRGMSAFIPDTETGKIYFFGGYSNAEFVPSSNSVARSHYDLWHLKLDMPGGHWDPADYEKDLRAETMGPWRFCFSCQSVGFTYKACGGSCGGKYYYCSTECQRAGWREHKEKHGCKKR